ncbi:MULTISPECIES: LysR family transcriptional regulator [Vibrio]|uniref:LysR family transcriptional regulator n=1 Tax=Vibrio bivalvicida TaxID=1276888 RepID=A0A177XXZ7_9VIBR|nr:MULTISPECIES: LysR family transcriptional regulator [Vibrio]KLN63854.1 LysR family transcriptional regulator [Vibrio sp. VPAP30]OAJ93226.1 LysR family transcriptional regulator [Vibrio bivalvicida]
MIALEHLHVVNVIHQEGSFRQASEKLFKARSAVSYSVKQVEEHYQIEIFDRDTYRPTLTREGKVLLQKIQRLLDAANEFDLFARQMNSETETELRISISAIFPTDKVTALLKQLKQSYPDTVIHLDVETASGERMLLDDKVDIGIYAAMELNQEIVEYRRVDTLILPVYVSDQFPLSNQARLNPNHLYDYPQVIVKSSYKTSPDSGIVKQALQWYVSDHHTKKSLIKSGLGWGRLTTHEAEHEPTLTLVPSFEPLNVPIYVARKKTTALGPVGLLVWEYFKTIDK